MAAHNRVFLIQRPDCKFSTTYLYETTKNKGETEVTQSTAASETPFSVEHHFSICIGSHAVSLFTTASSKFSLWR
jgi:hypothetical protein